MHTIPYLGQKIRSWQIGGSTFLAWPEAGARLMHWHLLRGDGSIRDVIHWPELNNFDPPIANIRGGNPILFPFSARSFDQGDIHFWRDPEGIRRPMPMHGIARQGKFRLDHIDAQGFRATLEPTAADQDAYPYDYEFTVTYRFESHRITCEFALRNLGTTLIPWSAGHHFYFTAPWTEGHTRDDYVIQFPTAESLHQTPTGTLIPGPDLPRRSVLSSPALVDTILNRLGNSTIRFGPADGNEHVAVTHGTAAKPSPEAALVMWTSSADAPFYCVEPWMGPPNAPETKRGLHFVPPGDTGRFSVQVSIG
jgi:galactose mutarotase-like enzyme